MEKVISATILGCFVIYNLNNLFCNKIKAYKSIQDTIAVVGFVSFVLLLFFAPIRVVYVIFAYIVLAVVMTMRDERKQSSSMLLHILKLGLTLIIFVFLIITVFA